VRRVDGSFCGGVHVSNADFDQDGLSNAFSIEG